MIINLKLPTARYSITMDSVSLAANLLYTGEDKSGNPKEAVTVLGYYGPGQVDLAIDRIIGEEVNKDQSVVNLREFLIKYRDIHETISAQVEDIKQQIKQSREK